MSIRDFIVKHIMFILERSKLSPTEEQHRELTETVVTRVRELLLQIYKLGFEVRVHFMLVKPVIGRFVAVSADQ